jgi:hypothetical protein
MLSDMSWLPDPAELNAAAARVLAQADALRETAICIALAGGTTSWQSVAATRFRDRLHETALALRTRAAQLDAAADLIRRHAIQVADGLPPGVRP